MVLSVLGSRIASKIAREVVKRGMKVKDGGPIAAEREAADGRP